MSTKTEQISADVKTAGEDVAALEKARGILTEVARDKADSAAGHGWGGVANNMQQAVEALEGLEDQLTIAAKALESGAGLLDEIDDKMSTPEVIDHLNKANTDLGAVDDAFDSAVEQVDEAVDACQRAGQTSLPEGLATLRTDVATAQEKVAKSKADIDTELEEADVWIVEGEESESASSSSN